MSLGLFLSFQLDSHLGLKKTKSVELASAMVNKSDKTIGEWWAHFFQNEDETQEIAQGKYKHSGIVWSREDLNKTATEYSRENAYVNGKSNLLFVPSTLGSVKIFSKI